jgi:hypothetical protein
MSDPKTPPSMKKTELFEMWPRRIPDLSALRAEYANDKETEDESLAKCEAWTPDVSNHD